MKMTIEMDYEQAKKIMDELDHDFFPGYKVKLTFHTSEFAELEVIEVKEIEPPPLGVSVSDAVKMTDKVK